MNLAYRRVSLRFSMLAIDPRIDRVTMMNTSPKKNLVMYEKDCAGGWGAACNT